MGYDLSNENGSFRFNIHGWGPILALAEKYGWEPAGTTYKKDRKWDGGYFSNDGQTVTRADAANIADALERSLMFLKSEELSPLVVAYGKDIPEKRDYTVDRRLGIIPSELKDEDIIVKAYGKEEGQWYPGADGPVPHVLYVDPDLMLVYKQDERNHPETVWSGDGGKERVIQFIEFCRQGSFNIY